MKICLIVDDSSVIRKVARRILEGLGFQIVEAEDGAQALSKCQQQLPDAILLDWNMPIMDGYEFLKLLRRLPGGNEWNGELQFCEHHVSHAASAFFAKVQARHGERLVFRRQIDLLGRHRHHRNALAVLRLELHRRPGILRLHHHPRLRGLSADADVRSPIDRANAIWAAARHAQQPARPVILEAPRNDVLARRVQRAGDRLAGFSVDALAVKFKFNGFR